MESSTFAIALPYMAAAIISGIIGPVVVMIIQRSLDKKRHEEEEKIDLNEMGEMVYVQEFVENLRDNFEFDRVSICQFHNGGKFLNGRSMKKFSMTYESAAPGIEKIKRKYQNILVSEFPKMVSEMMKTSFFIVNDDTEDFLQLRREMQTNGIAQAVYVPIRGLRGDMLGFISCHSIGTKNDLIGIHLQHEFVDKANQISGYLLK